VSVKPALSTQQPQQARQADGSTSRTHHGTPVVAATATSAASIAIPRDRAPLVVPASVLSSSAQQNLKPPAVPAPIITSSTQQGVKPPPSTQRAPASGGFQDYLEQHRRDFTRVEAAVGKLQTTMSNVLRHLDTLQEEVRTRPAGMQSGAATGADEVELLTENLSNVMTKTAEIDSIKLQLSVLQRRMKRLEDGSNPAANPAGGLNSVEPTRGSQPPPSSSRGPSVLTTFTTPAGFQAASTHKRPASESEQPEAKRIKKDCDDSTALSDPPQSIWRPAGPNGETYSPKRGPGRPRKDPRSNHAHENFGWSQDQHDIPMYSEYPGSVDRGGIVRRGGQNGPYMTPDGRRGRTKPIRNEEGVLIRKDGRPDRRSQTSAENLRRMISKKAEEAVYERKDTQLAPQQEGTNAMKVAGTSLTQPLTLDDDDDNDNEYASSNVGIEALAYNSRNGAGYYSGSDILDEVGLHDAEAEIELSSSSSLSAPPASHAPLPASAAPPPASIPPPSALQQAQPGQTSTQNSLTANTTSSTAENTHATVLRRMYPQGMAEDSRRLDFATHIFRTDTPAAVVSTKPIALMAPRQGMAETASHATPLGGAEGVLIDPALTIGGEDSPGADDAGQSLSESEDEDEGGDIPFLIPS
jgi:hypothetical protein